MSKVQVWLKEGKINSMFDVPHDATPRPCLLTVRAHQCVSVCSGLESIQDELVHRLISPHEGFYLRPVSSTSIPDHH